jgi:hypothetical protein
MDPLTVVLAEGDVDERFLDELVLLGLKGVVLKPDAVAKARIAHSKGLKVFYRPCIPEEIARTSPFELRYREQMSVLFDQLKGLSESDRVYWESPYFLHPLSYDLVRFSKLRMELFIEEISALETFSSQFLYALPEKPSCSYQLSQDHFDTLSRYILPKSPLVFSVYDGPADSDHLAQSPLWLTQNHNRIPLFSCERKAPFYLTEQVRRFFLKPLAGACLKVSAPLDIYAHANLNMCIQALNQKKEPELSLMEWFLAERPDVEIDPERLFDISACLIKHSFFCEAQQNHSNILAEDLKHHVEEFLALHKRLERGLAASKKKHSFLPKKMAFFNEMESALQMTKDAAKQALIHHKIGLPHGWQDD